MCVRGISPLRIHSRFGKDPELKRIFTKDAKFAKGGVTAEVGGDRKHCNNQYVCGCGVFAVTTFANLATFVKIFILVPVMAG